MKTLNEWEEIGEIRGEARGMVKLISAQLRRRMGDLPDSIRDRLMAMDSDKLQSLAEAMLDLSNYDEVGAWLDTNT